MQELNPNNYPTDDATQANLNHLLDQMNAVRTAYGIPMIVNSGLRTQADQERINPSAPKSKHILGMAADINDKDGSLWTWVLTNLPLMKQLGMYFEHPNWTHHSDGHGWVHFQTCPPGSGKRIFIPSPTPALAPDFWDGDYDHSFDD
jgi:hypothetical protein